MKADGYPVDAVEPMGAIYLSAQFDLVGNLGFDLAEARDFAADLLDFIFLEVAEDPCARLVTKKNHEDGGFLWSSKVFIQHGLCPLLNPAADQL